MNEGYKTCHLVSYLETMFVHKITEPTVCDEQLILAYYGLKEKPPLQSLIENLKLGETTWSVEWRNANRESKLDEVYVPGSAFWRGSGDDITLQKCIHNAHSDANRKERGGESLRTTFNNFRAAIFSSQGASPDALHNSFILSPVVPHDCDSIGKRIRQAMLIIEFLSAAGLPKIRVCILKGARSTWRNYSPYADKITREAEIITTNIKRQLPPDIRNKVVFMSDDENDDVDISFEIERSILKADLILAHEGASGNMLARILTNVATDFSLYAIPWFVDGQIWPIGEGAFINYPWDEDPTAPLRRAVMWNILSKGAAHDEG